MIGTIAIRYFATLLYDLFDQDKLIEYGIAYLEELRSLLNERVIDDVFRVHGAAPVKLLANWRDVCDRSQVQRRADLRGGAGAIPARSDPLCIRKCARLFGPGRDAGSDPLSSGTLRQAADDGDGEVTESCLAQLCTYFSEAFKQYTDDSFVNDVKKMRLEEAKRMLADDKIADINR